MVGPSGCPPPDGGGWRKWLLPGGRLSTGAAGLSVRREAGFGHLRGGFGVLMGGREESVPA